MRTLPRPYAAKLRRLHSLEKQVKALSGLKITENTRNRLLRRFRELIRALRHMVHTKWWLKPAVCIAVYLQVSMTEVTGQQFAPPVVYPFGLQNIVDGNVHRAVDIDSDGDQDVIGIGYDYSLSQWSVQYFENIGDATNSDFAPPVEESFGMNFSNLEGGFFAFAFGDLDGDGDLDLLANFNYVYNYDDEVYNQVYAYFENKGTPESPAFGLPQEMILPSDLNVALGFVQLEDIDDDGDLDLFANAFVYGVANNMYVYGFKTLYYENTGTPDSLQFAPATLHPFGIYGIDDSRFAISDFGDLDGDGDLDLLTCIVDPYAQTSDFIYQENIGTASAPEFDARVVGPFQLPTNDLHIYLPQLVDFDNDGDLDIFSLGYDYYGYETGLYYFENTMSSAVKDLEDAGVVLKVNPNPVTDILNLRLECPESVKGQFDLQVSDLSGRILKHQKVDAGSTMMDVQDLPAGVYQLFLYHAHGRMSMQFMKVE